MAPLPYEAWSSYLSALRNWHHPLKAFTSEKPMSATFHQTSHLLFQIFVTSGYYLLCAISMRCNVHASVLGRLRLKASNESFGRSLINSWGWSWMRTAPGHGHY